MVNWNVPSYKACTLRGIVVVCGQRSSVVTVDVDEACGKSRTDRVACFNCFDNKVLDELSFDATTMADKANGE